MNRIESKDLKVGDLAWYVQYQGESKPPSTTLVNVLTDRGSLVQNVLTAETFEPFLMYTYFESVHPKHVENQLKALRAQLERIEAEITILESL